MRIETIEQYLAVREAMEPIIVQGKTHKIAIPCANTLVVKRELVIANTYNPNSVPDDKMSPSTIQTSRRLSSLTAFTAS